MYINILNTYQTPRGAYHAIMEALDQREEGAKEDIFYLIYKNEATDSFINPPPLPEDPKEGEVYLGPADKDYWEALLRRIPHSSLEDLDSERKERYRDIINGYQTSLDENQIVVVIDQEAR